MLTLGDPVTWDWRRRLKLWVFVRSAALLWIFACDLMSGQQPRVVSRGGGVDELSLTTCPRLFLEIQVRPSFGGSRVLRLCTDQAGATRGEHASERPPGESGKPDVRKNIGPVSRELANLVVPSMFEAMRPEEISRLAKSGLVQLDGVAYVLRFHAGLVDLALEMGTDQRENHLITWMLDLEQRVRRELQIPPDSSHP